MTELSHFFEDITLQQPLVSLLQQEIRQGSVSHAYLFIGPPGSGKKSLALRFAFGILAQSDPSASLFFQEQRHPDLLVLSRPENKSALTKTQISDELIPWLGYKPYQATQKVAILCDAHSLSPEGANALLKTLEEPPDYAVLILVSDQENLLETICSRCRMVHFPSIPPEQMCAFLKKNGCEEASAQEIMLMSRGDAALALSFLHAELPALRQQAISLLDDLQTGQYSAVFALAAALEKTGKPLFHFIWMLLRDRLMWEETKKSELLLFPESYQMKATAPLVSREELFQNGLRIQQLWDYASSNVNPSLLFINMAWALRHCFTY